MDKENQPNSNSKIGDAIQPLNAQWTEKGGQEQFSDAESILSQRYVHYVGPSEI